MRERWQFTHFSVINYNMYSPTVEDIAERCAKTLRHADAQILARAVDGEARVDFAVATATGLLTVIRCVHSPTASDRLALITMIKQGDFDHAILVHEEPGERHIFEGVESRWIGDVDDLVASLARESRPA